MPELCGEPIGVRFACKLTAFRGRLLSGEAKGAEVLAGSFLRRREIVLDSTLAGRPRQFARILAHEVFHFVWARLANETRRGYELLLAAELARGARGELGWSAEWRKAELSKTDVARRTRRWREYVCESFCDTAAWVYSPARHLELTLARSHRERRRTWFRRRLKPPLSI